jgi:hypothetical protein
MHRTDYNYRGIMYGSAKGIFALEEAREQLLEFYLHEICVERLPWIDRKETERLVSMASPLYTEYSMGFEAQRNMLKVMLDILISDGVVKCGTERTERTWVRDLPLTAMELHYPRRTS